MKTFTTYAEKKAKQFFNLLQGYTRGIRITAILILLLMGVNNAWGATQRYIYVGISNNYQNHKDGNNFGLNVWGGTSGGVKSLTWIQDNYNWDGRNYTIYRAQVYDDNNKAQFKGNDNWWDPGDGYSVKLNGTTNNAIFFSHSNDGWQGQFQQNYQVTSNASLAANKTNVLVGESVTLTPSLTSNTTYNTLKSTSYEISPNTGASISSNTFKATKTGTYTVTATVTYNAKDFTGITKTATTTQTIKVYDTQYVLRGSINTTNNPEGGMAGWDATNNNAYSSATINGTTMTIVANLTNAKTQYKFKIYNNFDGSYYGQTGSTEIPNNTSWTLNGSNDVKFTTTVAGSYTFIYNTSNKSIKVQYPTAYTVTYSRVPTVAANAPTTTPSFSSGAYVLANTSVTFDAKTANTGYTWQGWYDNNAGTGSVLSSNQSYTRSITANTTIYAVYTANTYTVKFDANGGTGTMSNQNFTYGTAQNLTANSFTRTGYTFAGWATSANGNKVYNDKQSVSNLSSTNGATVTLYAKWTANQYTITYKDQGNVAFSGTHASTPPTTHTYGVETTLKSATRTDYTFEGWHTDAACTNKVSTLGATEYTADITLYAKWTPVPTLEISTNQQYLRVGKDKLQLSITYANIPDGHCYRVKVGDGYYNGNANGENNDRVSISGSGSVAFTTYSTLPGGTQPIVVELWTSNPFGATSTKSKTIHVTVEQGYQVSIYKQVGSTKTPLGVTISPTEHIGETATASALAGYTFTGWTSNTANITFKDASALSTLVYAKSGGDIYANFSAITYTITYNLNGGTNHADNPDKYTVETPTITLKNPTKTGYTFEGWYTEAGFTNKVTEIATGSTGDKIFYAKWTENKSTITVTTANSAQGTLKFGSTTKNWGTTASVGVTTTQNITVTANKGFKFVRWDLTGGAQSSSTLTNATITLKGDGNGTAGTATAVFEEDLNSSWHLVGSDNIFPDGWNVNDNSMMKKRSGYSSEKKVYMTITVSEIKTYEFKVVDDNGNNSDIWYGYSTGNTFLEWTETSTKTVYTKSDMSENSNNLKFTPNAAGNYEFKVDYSEGNPKVTITYPELSGQSIYLYGEFNDWQANGDYKFEEDANGLYILEREFTKRERWEACGKEQAEYQFKLNINGTNYTVEGDGDKKLLKYTRQNTTKVVNDGTSYQGPDYNLLLQADFTGKYIFTYDPKTQTLTVTHPEYTPEASYIVGDFSDGKEGTDAMPCIPDNSDEGHDWTEKFGKPFENGTADCVEFEDGTWNFKIKINGIWYGADLSTITTSGVYTLDDEYADTGEKNVTLTTNGEEGCYYFEYTVNPDGTLSVLIIFPNDRRTVTFEMQGHGTPVEEQRVLYNKTAVKPYVSDVDGYLFAGWYTDAACTKEYDFNTPVTKDITLYAKWIPYGDCIFYKNNLNWDEVYVYFYSSDKYWTDDKGTGAHKQSEFPMNSDHRPYFREFRGKMTRIGLTDIWYFDYISAAKQIDPTYWAEIKESKDIAFTAHEQHGHSFFDNTKVIRRGDFKPDMQLFVPQTDQTPTYLNKHDGVSTRYYNKGLWMIYNSTKSGYNWSSDVGNWDNSKNYFTSEIAGGYSFTAEVELNAGSTYEFKIHNQNGTWFGKNGTMTQDNCTNWWFKEEVNDNAKIKPTVNGTYIFTAYLGDGKVMISLDYPLSTGDYRLAYLDNTANSFHPGHYLKKRNENKLDTVSFFIHHDREPQVIAQRCTDIDAQGNATWETITSIHVNPAASITESGVYNFTLEQLAGQTDPRLLSQAPPYTGDYYIRTDAAPGGWKSFRQIGNMMTYNSYADEHEDFDHYFCEWVSQEKGLKNVKYTVANDYSYCISDTLSDDIDSNHPTIVTDKEGDLPKDNKGNLMNANVRWGWDSKTNKIRRAYIAGSGHKKDRFLVLEGNESLLDVNGKRFTGNTAEGQDRYNLTDDEVVFDDMGNWIYQMDVKANKDTKIDLTAKYNNLVQYFKGGSKDEDEILLIVTTNDNEKYYKIRIIYDFKTNHLISAWLPEDETITTDEQLGADMMIIRHNQEKAEQLNFNPLSSSLTKVGTAYAVMTFDKYFLNNKDKTGNELAEKKSENERKFYWISFPFDVKLSEVFGFGEYGDQWIMEYYDGEARAKEGYWAETETFWKYITNKNYVLKAGQGYVLCLNLNKMGFTSTVFAHTTEVSLYFPSTGPLNTITGELPTAVTVPAHECTIERDNRNIYDSNWNLIGVPGFADIKDVTIGESSHKELNKEIGADCVSFYYKYLPGTNTYSATTQAETFQTMYAYMVQFAGTINWQAKTMPAQLAARRTGSTPSQYDLRLELAQGEETDQTFVQLKEADVTAEFDMNVDMTKIFNSGMNIYTLTGSNAIQVAGNALPMEKATVPVGVRVATAGEYTFRMPDGTDGIAVTLVDNATGTHTNMLMSEYTVTLNAGTIENRFYLVVDPDRTATSVENIGEEAKGDKAKGVEKFLIDGKLFIRTADGIFDAKGQRM